MITITFTGEEQRSHAARQIAELDATKCWTLTVKLWRAKRSLSQNALFHTWVHLIADATGNDFDDAKNALKDLFLPLKVVRVGNAERMVRPETSSLAMADMSNFMTRVQAFAATELGIVLPTPEGSE